MGKMSELDAMIRERLERGEDPVDIAYALEIPVSWVYEVEECSPFATLNS
jgi:hypothetical protein